MKPAFSVVFLTTLIGAGQGLLIALVAGQFYHVIGAGAAPETGGFYAVGGLLALVLLCLGLVASIFHLANPQRGWRAATRWRTSWLSREVILIPAVCGLAVLYAGIHALGWAPVLLTFGNGKALDLPMAMGFLVVAGSVALFVCTGMIYACVRFIRQWASSWTVINYLLMGLASGFTLAAAYGAVMGSGLAGFMLAGAVVLTLLALVTRAYQLWANTTAKSPSSMKSAIGLHHTQIRQITQGFMGESFNTIEFAAPGGADTVKGLTVFFLLAGFAVPAALLLSGLPALAFVCQFIGLLAERWVFFAAGSHVQNLYYQAKA
ncbi:DMSO reductase [Paramagnetospirillum kuznetsovii]|uniref:DMSO reductase n=1 Tax=Paramagnetospirillum kuznetsovii TaxID=2053833 RepID=A0A364NTF9_9PROT|nr:DmsC/YnfH family molybdoenzyme membrane anchor subunit [Paramagnetospirillum kuznetsovii]RAU20373.1 DMSO reductase [Paramagnetospirillum kuznetsovii]